jgi:transitional endoplasmic reticulum ATPase
MNVIDKTIDKIPLKGDDAEIDWARLDTGLQYKGKAIVLPGEPGEMPIPDAIQTLERIDQANKQTYDVTEHIQGLPWDAAVATFLAMQSIYGVILPKTMMTWFGPRNPSFLTVKTGKKKTDVIQVPVGQITLPGMANPIFVTPRANGLYLSGTVTKKEQSRLIEIAIKARDIVNNNSIYKGKAIALKVDEEGDLDMSQQPDFFDVSHVKETDAIYNKITHSIIKTSIFAPIQHTDACRKHNVALKRGILLEGRYGCGKSLTARVTAKIAEDNGWTFIVLDRAQGLKAALETAKRYQPCVVFAEDIDRFGDRTKEKVNDLVNLLDGLVPLGSAIMTILTTNHIEKIDKALLRPGRLDAVISIDAPDAETVGRLIKHYAAEALPDDVSLEAVGTALAGQIPASIAEVVKRAKLAMLTEDRQQLTEDDLVTAAESAMRHLALLADMPPQKSKGDLLADSLTDVVNARVELMAEEMTNGIKAILEQVS